VRGYLHMTDHQQQPQNHQHKNEHEHIDYNRIKLGHGAPASLEASVILTLVGAGLILIGFPLMAFGGTIYIFAIIFLVAGVCAFTYGVLKGGVFVLAGYLRDFRQHWKPRYKKPALIGALVGLFFSLLFLPAAPVLMIVGAATAVHFARKAEGDQAFPSFHADQTYSSDQRYSSQHNGQQHQMSSDDY
ncbi:MAG TPA: hypothetical protein VGD95_01485, partial [Micavibrio sp.]